MGRSRGGCAAATLKLSRYRQGARIRFCLLARTYTARPVPSLTASFSKPFAAALRTQPPHEWQLLQSGDDWHIVRLEAVIPGHTATLSETGNALVEEWQQDGDGGKKAAKAVRTMAKPYVIRGAELP